MVNNSKIDITDRVHVVLIEQLGLEAVQKTDRLKEDLLADSLDYVELRMELEDEFDIDIGIDEIDSVETVQDLVDFVNKKTSQS